MIAILFSPVYSLIISFLYKAFKTFLRYFPMLFLHLKYALLYIVKIKKFEFLWSLKNQSYQKFVWYSKWSFPDSNQCMKKTWIKNLNLQEKNWSHIYYIFSYIQKRREEIKCNNIIKDTEEKLTLIMLRKT